MENNNPQPQPQPPKAHILLRAVCFFVVFLLVFAGAYRLGYHYHPNVAEWSGEGDARDAMVYNDTTYYLAGKLGTKGISSNSYKTEELLGEVKPESLLDPTPPLLLWSIENKEGYLILIDEEEDKYLYYAEGQVNPAKTDTDTDTNTQS